MKKEEIREYLKTIQFDESKFGKYESHIRQGKDFHLRFNMSGYDLDLTSTEVNTNILLLFAKFGIFNYTDYLFLDFFKGTPTIYLRYFQKGLPKKYDCFSVKIPEGTDLNELGKDIFEYPESKIIIEEDLDGATTCQIIERIFDLTVYSGYLERRR
jgi:hypothetical protein